MQQTLAREVRLAGVGVHTGVDAQVTLKPAAAEQGIELVRVDKGNAVIPLVPTGVVDTTLCTKLANTDGVAVQTIEHLFSALHGMGVDAVRIEIEGPEVPILDGSALPWVHLIEEAGLMELDVPKRFFHAPEAVVPLPKGEAQVVADAEVFELTLAAGFPVTGLEELSGSWVITPDVFKREIAPARTFCLMRDVERMRAAGLIQGGTLDCAVVFDDAGEAINPDGLRFADEPLRHKVLDAVGDLFLTGRPVTGRFTIPHPGHGVNNQLLRALVR